MNTPCPEATPLAATEYERLTAALLACVEACVDGWLQDDVIDVDAHRTGGLLELVFPDYSRIVINTQPALQELWLASRSGGYHFRHVAGRWLDGRDGREFFAALSHEASMHGGMKLHFAR